MSQIPKFVILNEEGTQIDTTQFEWPEQLLANGMIRADDCVLELGARYGSVSCVINAKLKDKTKHVCVEPDERVWTVLENNKERNRCQFHILKGCISNTPRSLTNFSVFYGYGTSSYQDTTSTIPSYRLDEVKEMFGIKDFTALVADCEGCLEDFLNENLSLLDSLRILLFEQDYPEHCNYNKIFDILKEHDFIQKKSGLHTIWMRKQLTVNFTH